MAARKRVSIQDVAARAGVSAATVSRVLNNDSRVAPATRTKVLAAVKATGYQIPRPAGNDARRIGVVLATEESVYYMALATAIRVAMRARGYQVIFGSLARGLDAPQDVLDTFYECKVGGVILIACGYDAIKAHLAPAVEHVWIDCNDAEPGHPGVCAIQSDHYYSGRLAGQELLRAGKTKPVVLTHASVSHRARDRWRGLAEEFASAGIELAQERILATRGVGDQVSESREALRYAAAKGIVFDSVWAIADERTLGAYHALDILGLGIPGDVGLIGFDGISPAVRSLLSITSIAQNVELLAAEASDVLDALMEGREPAARRVVVPTSVLPGRTL